MEARRIASIVLKAVRDKPPPVLICPCPRYSESYEVPVIIGMFHARRISRFFFSLLPLALIPLFFLISSPSFFLSSCPCRRNGGSNSKNHYDLISSVNNPSPSYISQSRCPTRQSLFKSPLAVSFRFVCSSRLAIILYPFVQILLAFRRRADARAAFFR